MFSLFALHLFILLNEMQKWKDDGISLCAKVVNVAQVQEWSKPVEGFVSSVDLRLILFTRDYCHYRTWQSWIRRNRGVGKGFDTMEA